MFYEQLSCAQIPKAQKDSLVTSVFFALFGSAHVKAACKMMVKFTSVRCKFHQHFYVRTSFRQLFLVTFWLWQKIRMQNARVKRWWNSLLSGSIICAIYRIIFSYCFTENKWLPQVLICNTMSCLWVYLCHIFL